jgi:hypothetical protein
MYRIGLTEILLYLTLATFFAIWKTVGPPRFGHRDLFAATIVIVFVIGLIALWIRY